MPRLHFLLVALGLVLTAPAAASAQAPPDRTAYALARDSAWARPVNRSLIAFTIPQKDLLAENVAHDPETGAFFVGSTRHGTITRRDADGRVSDFAAPARDGLWMVIGMKVDAPRRLLWVNTTAGANYVRHRAEDQGRTALVAYDLRSGALARRLVPSDTGRHFFNDLAVAGDGTVYVTDMTGGAIYRLRAGAEALERWHVLQGATFPNGITLSGDGRTLYVAHREGIGALDVASREWRALAAPEGVDPLGIDGLYWLDGALLGVQGGWRNRVQRFALSPDGRAIAGATVVEAHHPMFMNPTTGVVVGRELYYVANSQFGSFAPPDRTLFPAERLFETVILRVTP